MIAFITNVTVCTEKEKQSFEKNGDKVVYTTIGLRHDEYDNIVNLVVPAKYVDNVEARKGEVAKQVTLVIGDDKKAKIKSVEY